MIKIQDLSLSEDDWELVDDAFDAYIKLMGGDDGRPPLTRNGIAFFMRKVDYADGAELTQKDVAVIILSLYYYSVALSRYDASSQKLACHLARTTADCRALIRKFMDVFSHTLTSSEAVDKLGTLESTDTAPNVIIYELEGLGRERQ